MNPLIAEAFAKIDHLNKEAAFLNESALSNVSSFIDTGSYALNAIMSGSLYRGVPSGRIVGLVGPSGCGKTLIMNKIIANAQKAGRYALVWDSEVAVDAASAANVGCDIRRYKHIPIGQIEKTRNEIVAFLDMVIENPSLKGQFIIGIDSLANLASAKEEEDAGKGKDASDMGLRAKSLKSMFRTITYKCAKADCPLIFTNHIYDNPAALYAQVKKNMSGGKGPEYMASIVVQLNQTLDKTSEETGQLPNAKAATGGQISGINMNALTTKNRFVPPFLETELHLNFVKGLDPYAGLYELVTAFSVLDGVNSFTIPTTGEKIGRKSEWMHKPEVWTKIMPLLEAKLAESIKFGAVSCEGSSPEDDNQGSEN